MKNFKKLTAIILCFAMLCGICAATASALNIGDTVYWEYDAGTGYHIHTLDGYLTEGKTTLYPIPLEDGEGTHMYGTYEFEVEKTGCYFINPGNADVTVARIYEGNEACESAQYSLACNDNEEEIHLYYLEKGTALLRIVAADEGSTIEIGYHSETGDVEMFETASIVESVEVENIDALKKTYVYYNGMCGYVDAADMGTKVTVNFKDGSKSTFDYKYDEETNDYNTNVTFPDGSEHYVAIYQWVMDVDGEYAWFIVDIDGYEFVREICDFEKVSFSDNSDLFKENINEYKTMFRENISWCMEYIFSGEDAGYYISQLFSGSVNYIGMMFKELAMFLANAF